MKRTHRVVVTLNDEEQKVFVCFARKHQQTIAGCLRTAAMRHILQQLDQEAPTLFD